MDAYLKELRSAMPVIFAKAIPADRQETKHTYECPVYKTKTRGPQPRLDLQVEEQREGGQMGPGRRGPPAGGVTTALAEGLLFLPLEHRRDVLVPARLFILLRGIKQSPAYVPFK